MAYKKFTASTKQLAPDARFGSKLVSKFINCLMWDGKKAASLKIFYGAMEIIEEKIKDATALEVFEQAVENVKPMLEVLSKRVGGATYQVPMQVSKKRQLSLGIRWMIQAVRSGSGSPCSQRLAGEIMSAYRKEGTAMTTRDNVHRIAEANKAFAHFAW